MHFKICLLLCLVLIKHSAADNTSTTTSTGTNSGSTSSTSSTTSSPTTTSTATTSTTSSSTTNSGSSQFPYTCDPKNRPQICTMEYLGVCAWFDSTVKCIAYPCAQTEATICSACSKSNVEKVTLGECPKTGSTNSSSSSSNNLSLATLLIVSCLAFFS